MSTNIPDQSDPLESRLDKIELAIEALTKSNDALTQKVEESNLKIDLYQKASQQVVNLAFGLLSVAALSLIIPAVIGK